VKRDIHVLSTIGLSAVAGICGEPLVAGGCWLGIMLHPDLDLGDTPYGKVRKHRGLSHWPVIGTVDRLAWFCGPLILILWPRINWELVLPVIVGLVLADLLHTGLDLLDKALVKKGVNL